MNESESKNEKPKEERRFSQEQYERLKRCSENKDMTEWNEWRRAHPDDDILLEGEDANFKGWYLEGVYLYFSKTYEPYEGPELTGKVYLKGAKFNNARLSNARFDYAHLEGSNFYLANLKGTDFGHAWLQGANFTLSIVDNSTVIWGPPSKKEKKTVRVIETIDRNTIFTGVPLENMRIDPGTKQLLEYNIRCKNWEEWYKERQKLKWLVKPFWWISDYGLRTWRIIVTFFGLAIAFGVVYWLCPSCVIVMGEVGDIRGFWHALYFSVVTMTTLGFGDIAANPDSRGGQTLLMLQVILGYVLLGALVTRFAVLFTAGGPAGKFADEKKNRNKTTEKKK